MTQYSPQSYFYTDPAKLKDATDGNPLNDAFGPVKNSETTKYRVTSFVNSIGNSTKVFAIVGGQVAILQQDGSGNENKVNLVIKNSSQNFSPLKIKYFIYRGIDKSDLIDSNNNIVAENTGDPNQPKIIKRLWDAFLEFNPGATNFPANLIGYETGSVDSLIDDLFCKNVDFYCNMGEHLGNFSDKLGLDIVLDYGDYILENQEVLFSLTQSYAKAHEFIFDISAIIDLDTTLQTTKRKRYKEYIHQFLDASAFWGSHINCGIIKLNDGSKKTSVSEISPLLKKYQTSNKIYIYIRAEDNRSYGYYDNNQIRKIYGFEIYGEENKTNDWPILIKEISSDKEFLIEYQIDNQIIQIEQRISYDVFTSKYSQMFQKTGVDDLLLIKNVLMSYSFEIPTTSTVEIENGEALPSGLQLINGGVNHGKIIGVPTKTEVKKLIFNIIDTEGNVKKKKLTFYVNAVDIALKINFDDSTNKASSDFMFINCYMKQKFPLNNYFDCLWIANVQSSVASNFSQNDMYCTTYEKNFNINLDNTIGQSALIRNKILFDEGKKKAGTITTTKKRRTFIAIISNNSGNDVDLKNLNIDGVSSSYFMQSKTSQNYFLNIFNDNNFSIYMGSFIDSQTAKVINSLCVFHNSSLFRKYSYMFLGITEDEYDKFVIPIGADNVFFNLDEDNSFTSENIRKFKLGLRYEDSTGGINPTIVYPSAGNEVYVYSIDNLFFFSSEYSAYQIFSEKYLQIKAEFRIQQPYNGEFGFDWMRIGDTSASGDVVYSEIVGKQYEDSTYTNVVKDINKYDGYFKKIPDLYKKLQREYLWFPMQWEANKIIRYYLPILNIYPPHQGISGIDLDRQAIFVPPYNDEINRIAKINLKINTKVKSEKITLEYDDNIINIFPINPVIPTTIGEHNITLTINAKKEIDKDSYIYVKSLYKEKTNIIGALKISANSKVKRKSKKTVLIMVTTNINGTNSTPLLNNKALDLKKYLRQIFITPILDKLEIDLSISPVKDSFNNDYVYNSPVYGKVLLSSDYTRPNLIPLHKFITSQQIPGTSTTIEEYYKDYFICIFFDENGGNLKAPPTNYESLNGYSAENKYTVQFKTANSTTPSHEFLHSSGVSHSFTASEADINAKYTYQYDETDNLLDYSYNRKSLWEWQGKIARKNSNYEP